MKFVQPIFTGVLKNGQNLPAGSNIEIGRQVTRCSVHREKRFQLLKISESGKIGIHHQFMATSSRQVNCGLNQRAVAARGPSLLQGLGGIS